MAIHGGMLRSESPPLTGHSLFLRPQPHFGHLSSRSPRGEPHFRHLPSVSIPSSFFQFQPHLGHFSSPSLSAVLHCRHWLSDPISSSLCSSLLVNPGNRRGPKYSARSMKGDTMQKTKRTSFRFVGVQMNIQKNNPVTAIDTRLTAKSRCVLFTLLPHKNRKTEVTASMCQRLGYCSSVTILMCVYQ